MTDPTFRAKIRPELHPAAQELVAIYEAVPGAITYPGCCPEAMAAVLDWLMADPPLANPDDLTWYAAILRGEQP